MLLTKSLEDKQQEKEMHEMAVKVAFVYKEKKIRNELHWRMQLCFKKKKCYSNG